MGPQLLNRARRISANVLSVLHEGSLYIITNKESIKSVSFRISILLFIATFLLHFITVGTPYYFVVIYNQVFGIFSVGIVTVSIAIHVADELPKAYKESKGYIQSLIPMGRALYEKTPNQLKNRQIVVFGSILLVGTLFRVRDLGATPLWIDEAFTSWSARNFVNGQGFSDPIGPSSPYRRAWVTTSLPIAVSFLIFGVSDFAARVPIVIYGLINVYLAYLLGSRISKTVGYLMAAFLSFSPIFVVWSRTARVYEPAAFLYLFTLYLLIRWYYDTDLKVVSKYPPLLGVLVVLGWDTQPAYLAIGPSILVFLIIELSFMLRGQNLLAFREYDLKTKRLIFILGSGISVASLFLLVKGIPYSLVAPPPETWEQPPKTYYWNVLGDLYPILRLSAIIGIPYAWVKYKESRMIALCFLLPLLVASLVPRKAFRYIYHLLPLLAFFGFIPIIDVMTALKKKRLFVTADHLSAFRRGISYLVPLLLILVITNPMVGFSVADQPHHPPYHAERSDWEAASDWVSKHSEENDVYLSTRPELSMWYFGETDYFFRQRGVKDAKYANGEYVHTRTGAVYLNSTEKVRSLVQEKNGTVWLFAAKKFDEEYTNPYTREFVTRTGHQFSKRSWKNMRIYYWFATVYSNYFSENSWRNGIVKTKGNLKTLEDEGGATLLLALGRTAEEGYTTLREENTTAQDGTVVIRQKNDGKEPLVVKSRLFASEERNAKITISSDGTVKKVITVESGGWQIMSSKIDGGDEFEIKIESEGSSGLGVLVDYVRVYREDQKPTVPSSSSNQN